MSATPLPHAAGFHLGADAATRHVHAGNADRFVYDFENFSHPFIENLITRLNQTSVAGMLDPTFLQTLEDKLFFSREYPSHPSSSVQVHSHPRGIDLTPGGPFWHYHFELFCHLPTAIAVYQFKQGKHAEAERWFHHVFEPTCTHEVQGRRRWWKFLGFRSEDVTDIEALFELLGTPDDELTTEQIKRKQWIHNSYEAILSHPFDPHAVARARPVAYQYYIVIKYLENKIAWGDSCFLEYTVEKLNEAMMHYVLAANIYGPRAQKVPMHGTAAPKSFAQLKNAVREMMGTTLVELETQIPFNSALAPPHKPGQAAQNDALFGVAESLYFCVPKSDAFQRLGDIIADRLFKIRNCMDITGVVRPLALWDPPIDPGMLIKAQAAGIDVASIVSGLNRPVGPLRSLVEIQKALQLTGELKFLESAFLSACEKMDAEELAFLRQRHEVKLQKMTQEVRFLQAKQAREATEALLSTRATTLETYKYYLRLLGKTPDAKAVPDTIKADHRRLTEENFAEAYHSLVGTYVQPVAPQAFQTFPGIQWPGGGSPNARDGEQLYLSAKENAELDELNAANNLTAAGTALQATAPPFRPVPNATVKVHFWGLGTDFSLPGGKVISDNIEIGATLLHGAAAFIQGIAGMTSKMAGYERRADEWRLKANEAAHELVHIGRQIITSLIAEQVEEHNYRISQTQVASSEEVERRLLSKLTNAELYRRMKGETHRIHLQFHNFVLERARKAERMMKWELMRPELDATTFMQPTYMRSGREGLLPSAEAMFFDLTRMEMAYHDNNKRELELTRHVSLRQLDPRALLALRVTGSCTVSIPEWLYDLHTPGHYMRRIKAVAVSIPAVVGPYTSVHCTLTLLRSSIRVSPVVTSGYPRDTDNPDDRFVDYLGSTDTIVTSTGTSDTGMFETNLRDDRFLHFEGAGVVSTWRLELPQIRTFDHVAIPDVMLQFRHTARPGGTHFAAMATKEVVQAFNDASASPLTVLFSLRHDFPTEWAAFVNGKGDLAIPIRKNFFPYLAQSGRVTIDGLTLYTPGKNKLAQHALPVPDDFSDGINGPDETSTLRMQADRTALTRSAKAQVFLIVQYHLGG
jgi:hypothetical protein